MQAAAQQFVGTHDFLALCAAGSSAAAHGDTVRTITDCHVTRRGDEIDIEVLGKDTTKVQFNYYTNGVGNHEYMYDLGFDASEGFHTYGFDWQADHITWYVDGKAVYTAYDNIPTTAGKIMMNAWPGIGVDDWLKPFNGNTPLTARYQWVTYNQQ